MIEYVSGAFLAFLGALAYIFLWKEYKLETALRHSVLAIIAGVIYTLLRVEHGYPDLLVTFVTGYFAPDFIAGILERVKPK